MESKVNCKVQKTECFMVFAREQGAGSGKMKMPSRRNGGGWRRWGGRRRLEAMNSVKNYGVGRGRVKSLSKKKPGI